MVTFVFLLTTGYIEGMSDGDRFQQTGMALGVIGMSDQETHDLLCSVSGVLHLGQARESSIVVLCRYIYILKCPARARPFFVLKTIILRRCDHFYFFCR